MSDPGMVTEPVRVEITADGKEEAERLARSVIESRLAACAQVGGPIVSFYRWQGEVCRDEEWTIVCKTSSDRLGELTAHVVQEHTYDVPEVAAVPLVGGNPEYLEWVVTETRADT